MTRSGRHGTRGHASMRGAGRRGLARLGALLGVTAVMACGAARPTPLALLEAPSARSVAELLSTLPEELLARYVLMRRSRSPEPATDDAPRVLLYSDDAKLVVAFSGAGNAVDVMRFDDATTSFVFREIRFSDVQGVAAVRVSEPNPARCSVCHGTPARPVWDTYPLWPGAFGETEEPAAVAADRAARAEFDAARESHPRYRHLGPPREKAVNAASARYGVPAPSSNAELTALLGALNAKVVAAELRGAPDYDRRRYELLEALLPACDERAASRGRARVDEPAFASFAARTREVEVEQQRSKRARALEHAGASPLADSRAMTRLRFIAERDMGMSTASWTLALEKGSFDFVASRSAASSFEARLFMELGGGDERLASLYWQGGDVDRTCAYLEGRSATSRGPSSERSATSGRSVPLIDSPAEGPGPLLERCASCHEQGVGPPIPFRDRAALARRLSSPDSPLLGEIRRRLDPAAGDARMPPNLILPSEVRARFLAFLLALETRARSVAATSEPPLPRAGVMNPAQSGPQSSTP